MHYVIRNYAKHSHFNYDKHGKDWKVEAGKQQSPIALTKEKAVRSSAPKLTFVNYDKTFASPLKLTNNGHTITMEIPPGANGSQPALCGCMLESIYKAVQLHFHWGSPHQKGSEHKIGFSRYDAEMHIVHQNCAYALKKEALTSPDGFVVLGLMLKLSSDPVINPLALNNVCWQASKVKKSDMYATFKGEFALRDFLTGIERQEFFTYKGSLTTPPCSEVVNWFVFPKPIEISKRYLKHLWNLSDDRGRPLLNNFRELQELHERNVYYRNQIWPNDAQHI